MSAGLGHLSRYAPFVRILEDRVYVTARSSRQLADALSFLFLLLTLLLPAHICCADMDGFKLLEAIGLELDLPVISEHCSF